MIHDVCDHGALVNVIHTAETREVTQKIEVNIEKIIYMQSNKIHKVLF